MSKPDFKDEQLSIFNIVTEIESIPYLFLDQQHRVEIKKEFKDPDALFYGKRNQMKKGLKKLDLILSEKENLKEFIEENRKEFENQLLSEAVNVKDKINEIFRIGNIDLLGNAYKLILHVVEGQQHELMVFARQEGQAWAKHELTISFKLEWLQSIRRVLWDFLYNYNRLREEDGNREEFFQLEKNINGLLDDFLNHFFISYTQYKEQLLQSQQKMIDDLTVPVIPLTSTMSILPLIGSVDSARLDTIRQKIFEQIDTLKTETLIIDLSGSAFVDISVLSNLSKVLEGIQIMGCKLVITGFRPEVVKDMVDSNVTFNNKAETKGTLQQALEHYLKNQEDAQINV